MSGLGEFVKAKQQAAKALMGVHAKGLWDVNRGGLHDTLGKRWFFRASIITPATFPTDHDILRVTY
jgi:hypothetical protein